MLLERRGSGLAHDKPRRDEPLTGKDVLVHLSHSRVTEQRAAGQMDMLVKYFGDHPEVGRPFGTTSHDEEDHLAYCHEELLRLARAGHGRTIQRVLRECAVAESRVYRDVSLAVMAHTGRVLKWPGSKFAAPTAGIHAGYAYERLGGRRRVVGLTMPRRRDALGGPAGDPATSAAGIL